MTSGLSNTRAKPRLEVLDRNGLNTIDGMVRSFPVTVGVTILSGQVCSIDATTNHLVLGWVAGNAGPYFALNDTTDTATKGTGLGTAASPYHLTVVDPSFPRTIRIGYYKAADTYLPNSPLTPDGVTGDVKVLTNNETEVNIGRCTHTMIQYATPDTSLNGANENAPVGAVTTNIPDVNPATHSASNEYNNVTSANMLAFVTCNFGVTIVDNT